MLWNVLERAVFFCTLQPAASISGRVTARTIWAGNFLKTGLSVGIPESDQYPNAVKKTEIRGNYFQAVNLFNVA
jgi:hypothetical protein